MVFIDFRLPLAPSGGRRKRFGNGFSIHFVGESNLRIMSWIVGLGAVAGGLSAASSDRADRTWPQIAQSSELMKNLGALGFQFRQGIRHVWWPLC